MIPGRSVCLAAIGSALLATACGAGGGPTPTYSPDDCVVGSWKGTSATLTIEVYNDKITLKATTLKGGGPAGDTFYGPDSSWTSPPGRAEFNGTTTSGHTVRAVIDVHVAQTGRYTAAGGTISVAAIKNYGATDVYVDGKLQGTGGGTGNSPSYYYYTCVPGKTLVLTATVGDATEVLTADFVSKGPTPAPTPTPKPKPTASVAR